ncbi:MAG: hypothetical protein AXW12_13260 [Thalassospira sp. Nap_22]|nr:MAG: hypothetical protein AXW12_13260 [Thalassospira sp. Nap_22]
MLVFPIVPFCIRDAMRPDVAAEIGWLTGQGLLERMRFARYVSTGYRVITPFRNNVPRGEMPANFSARSSQK